MEDWNNFSDEYCWYVVILFFFFIGFRQVGSAMGSIYWNAQNTVSAAQKGIL
jgi:hypothetical protein